MAASAPSPLVSSVEKTNGAKLSRLLIDGGTTVLRKIFDGHHPPANLITDLNANYSVLNNLLRRRVLNGHQWDKLFPPGGVPPDSNTFDITLLFLLLTKICGLTPPPSGWHTKPPSSDTSHEANLARVKFYRNILYGHVTTTGVDTPTFSALWTEIGGVLVSLGLDQAEVDKLKVEKGGEPEYIDVLIKWADSERDIKSQLKNIHQSQSKIQQAVEDVRQNLAKTQKTVEEVFQAQTKTQEAVEDVRHAVQSLRERDKVRADEVLRKLAKCEFRGDIEYYVERFQEGTREWVFDRVQNWLDDRTSQNRVMVISGNAGMGKSVIAAVICKRMQDAGRLSGIHFCQYNNVRFCKPQLMLQSLACHLSDALPEYKNAVAEHLSRNLGIDLNNVGVEELFSLLFKEPLASVGDPGRNILMVIDGLDESEYQGRNALLDVIASQFWKLPPWIRCLVTTRPGTTITENIKHLKPLELTSNEEMNLKDIRTFVKMRLRECVVQQSNIENLTERLVRKSEGLMLHAHFLILFINENEAVLSHEDLDRSLPLGISTVYKSYFQRLESELKLLQISEELFNNLLSAIIASREPLPVKFISKILSPNNRQPLGKRTLLKALGCVSMLLPIRDGRLHVIHRSVKDWLMDDTSYGEHEFLVDENDGHRILANLCIHELDAIKQQNFHNLTSGTTEEAYALSHGARHVLHSSAMKREPHKFEELVESYVFDLELVYSKLCLNSTDDIVWLQREGIATHLTERSQGILDTLLMLLRKYHDRFFDHPYLLFQNLVNEGGTVLSARASNLLQSKYATIPYVEYVHKETQQMGVVAQFRCPSEVACLDVSPELDYMVCECSNGILQLWSLHSGHLLWTRPVRIKKSQVLGYWFWPYRKLPSSSAWSFYRSVVFHPTEQVVLPGVLSHAYTIEGDLKPLFSESKCKFTVCSISGDKSKILTNCPDNPKCLVMWSLKNGSQIACVTRTSDILSFAWSRDGRLLAISHSSRLICLVDVTDGFKTLAQTNTAEVCGMLKLSPDHRFLFCLHRYGPFSDPRRFIFDVKVKDHDTFSLHLSSSDTFYDHKESGCFSDCGFVFGDPILTSFDHRNYFILHKEGLLTYSPVFKHIKLLRMDKVTENSEGQAAEARKVLLSLDGQTVYILTDEPVPTVQAWDVKSGKLIAAKSAGITRQSCLVTVSRGLLFTESSGAAEVWNFNLSECLQRWTDLPLTLELIALSEERVASVGAIEVKVLDTSCGEITSTITFPQGRAIACNSKCQLLIIDMFGSLQLWDGTFALWEKDLRSSAPCVHYVRGVRGSFSPAEEFIILSFFDKGVYIHDAFSGSTLRVLFTISSGFPDCKFVSDEACIVCCGGHTVQLFNVKSGDLLSVIDLESRVTCSSTCLSECLFAIGFVNSISSFKVIQVRLPHSKDRTKGKR